MKQTNQKTIILQTSLEELKTKTVELICVNRRPLTILRGSAVVRLFSVLVQQLGDYSINRNYLKTEIKVRANKISGKDKNKVFSTKEYIATKLKRSVLWINCQVIKTVNIYIYNLVMKVLKKRLTAENINIIIKQVLHECEISISNLYTVTTDNGSNFITSGELLKCDQIIENFNTEGNVKYFY